MDWRVRAIRGATTVTENTAAAMREAVSELLDTIEAHNQFDPSDIVSVTFSVTRDLDALFPAAIARERPDWDNVPLLDVQQMHVPGSLERCIRVLIHLNTCKPQTEIHHAYLRRAQSLRPDLPVAQLSLSAPIR
ncbi:chorismate mutase [Synechocystis sp. LKSZ1]|uniref:chorismate mutase n=1 Tax=Synechocystis sp. LKSZ1 TaxID=3144951 RepID=UPI00336C061F